ncbi:nucleotidyltransferase-like protein [Evansella sp. AB-P1]|uniref:nucleotidyltransferase-like protein n=1 Tax=Evansella sp. AB-P1 TaxID=3037653 RepID=UPI00241FDFC7|nr:nucleotidyltransferase-like protein [Evansella sp. AB-P1]MDG5786285.1 nucleotidyltransferase-like protein [Evansella sp. AB-P1]
MDNFLRQLYQDRSNNDETLSIIQIDRRSKVDSNTDFFDVVLLVVNSKNEATWEIKHYTYNGYKAAMHLVSTAQIKDWLLNSSNRRIVDWLMNGKVVYDRNEYITNFRHQMLDFPIEERKIKIGVEFSKLIRRFKDGKALFYEKHYLDAYNQIVHALHHLARVSIIDHGFYPEVTVWQQVKQIEPEIYKLYSELVTGNESIEKKLELLLLANEFELITKTKLGSTHIIELMKRKESPWTIEEIKQELGMHDYSLDLTILIEYLVQKGYINVVKEETKGKIIFHRYYQVNEK